MEAIPIAGPIIAGEQARKQQKRARTDQQRAQSQATMMAIAERRRAGDAERRVNQRTPDTMALLAAAQQAGENGVGSTFLSSRKRKGTGGEPTLLGDAGYVAT